VRLLECAVVERVGIALLDLVLTWPGRRGATLGAELPEEFGGCGWAACRLARGRSFHGGSRIVVVVVGPDADDDVFSTRPSTLSI
jgi:hypothetical protein